MTRDAPQRRLLGPGHSAQVVEGVDVGVFAAAGHAERQVALPEVQGVVQDHNVCGYRVNVWQQKEA